MLQAGEMLQGMQTCSAKTTTRPKPSSVEAGAVQPRKLRQMLLLLLLLAHLARSASMQYSSRGLQATAPLLPAALPLRFAASAARPLLLLLPLMPLLSPGCGARCKPLRSCKASSMLCCECKLEAAPGVALRAAAACCCCFTVGVLEGARGMPTVGRPAQTKMKE